MRAVLHVCTTCRGTVPDPVPDAAGTDAARTGALGPDAPRLGARLHDLLSRTAPDGVEIRPVECLSACSQGCSVALSAPGKWSYVYGRLTLDDAADILSGARAYAGTADGIVPWRERPAVFRKQSLARIPPHTLSQE